MSYGTPYVETEAILAAQERDDLICRCGGSSEPLVGNEAIVSYEMHAFIALHEDCGAVAA